MEQLQDKLRTWIENPNRDFSEGISLLTHLTNNRMLIRNLNKNENKYRRDKLLYELQKHYKLLPPITTPTAIEHETDPPEDQFQGEKSNGANTDIPPVGPAGGESEPGTNIPSTTNEGGQPGNVITNETGEGTVLKAFRTDAKAAAEDLKISYTKMYNKKGILINSLREFKEDDNEGRKNLVEQIAGLNRDMQAVDSKIKHFKEHGQLPDQEPEQSAEPLTEKQIPDDPIKMQQMLLNERSNISKIKRKITEGASSPEKLGDLEKILLKKTELVNEIQRRLGGIGS